MMFRLLLLLFVIVPLIELYVLIEVGRGIGGIATILLCVFTALLGGLLIRLQGLMTLLSAQRELASGGLPAEHVLHGLMLGIAGLLLFTPGFITDALGFLLLIPAVRHLLILRFVVSPVMRSRQHDGIIDVEVIPHDDKKIR